MNKEQLRAWVPQAAMGLFKLQKRDRAEKSPGERGSWELTSAQLGGPGPLALPAPVALTRTIHQCQGLDFASGNLNPLLLRVAMETRPILVKTNQKQIALLISSQEHFL